MPDEHLEQREELDRALSCAEPDERAVLAMRYLHGWEYDRIAQALVQRVEHVLFREVDELPPSGRGAGGFGSTGR